MKIKPEHLDHMRTAISAVLANNPDCVNQYESGQFHNADKVKNLQKRFCFDLLNASGLTQWTCDTVYRYANDTHVFTALRSICPKVERRY